ncbi:tetraacyldisaccharide 4'-kinase [Sansalvadorimonas sp. 2012CJ34-2]|uniref:Tetraacyldisaccharide 4'-kinase n=1 Tax=Parendozoicomonas callyspongiae TaxID=2942213 RepID=A0ABT0PEI5_9GAMM|nr:tetraacyldisaccharide 4'-kinase [Sansalvadorimonas sp. 2012CJ34-2]MCL6269794.1 tetraacyldisaccharide 4'-kinase [Sansalvadorimonas sp. 2012CJ34-2]
MASCSISSRLKTVLSESITRSWYQHRLTPFMSALSPLSALVSREAKRRLQAFQGDPPWKPPVPVIVVGNITVGGTGKTPLVAAMVRRLREAGYRPGIISRGYKADAAQTPRLVTRLDLPMECGDEPVMLADLTGVPVVVSPDRAEGVRFLLQQTGCNLVISDDGLQHYKLHRDIEIVVIDGRRGLGNGRCLPAGPLREPTDRLNSVDYIISNGQIEQAIDFESTLMKLENTGYIPVAGGEVRPLDWLWQERRVHGVAGIGNPERFFSSLESCGFEVDRHPFADHHAYDEDDLSFRDQRAVIMTGKDAIKCRSFAQANWWYLAIEAVLPEPFWESLLARLSALGHGA